MMNLKSPIFRRVAFFFASATVCLIACLIAASSVHALPFQVGETDAHVLDVERDIEEDGKDDEGKNEVRKRPRTWKYTKQGGIVYSKPENSKPLKCDVYVPDAAGVFPAVLMIHGGAWRSGSKFHLIRHAWELAARGYVVVAINYRHAPRHKLPAQIYDCKEAVRWMKKNASTYKIDPERIGVYGYSAGGHLAGLLGTTTPADRLEGPATRETESYGTSVQAVAIGGAPCEFSWVGRDSRALVYLFGATRSAKPQRYERASPITFVDSTEVPFRIFHGKSDVLVPLDSPQAFFKRLQEYGVECEAEWLDTGHFGAFSDFKAFDRTIDFFDKHLGRPALHPAAEN